MLHRVKTRPTELHSPKELHSLVADEGVGCVESHSDPFGLIQGQGGPIVVDSRPSVHVVPLIGNHRAAFMKRADSVMSNARDEVTGRQA